MAAPASRIVVPTDFSEASDHALDTAVDLAARIDAEVELLAVVPKSEPLFPRYPDNRDAAALYLRHWGPRYFGPNRLIV